MMKIACNSIRQQNGVLKFKWTAKFSFSMRIPIDPIVNKLVVSNISELRKVSSIFLTFESWFYLQNYVDEGFITEIVLTDDHIEPENGNYLFGKILSELKQNFYKAHPKIACQSDKGGI